MICLLLISKKNIALYFHSQFRFRICHKFMRVELTFICCKMAACSSTSTKTNNLDLLLQAGIECFLYISLIKYIHKTFIKSVVTIERSRRNSRATFTVTFATRKWLLKRYNYRFLFWF